MTLNVTFCKGSPNEKGIPALQIGDVEDVTITASAASASAAPSYCRIVRLVADEKTRIAVNTAPTGASGVVLLAGSTEYFGVSEGDVIQAIAAS